MDSAFHLRTIETFGQKYMVFVTRRNNFCLCCDDSCLLSQQMAVVFPQCHVIIIVSRWKLCQTEHAILIRNSRLRTRSAQRGSRMNQLLNPLFRWQQVFLLTTFKFHTGYDQRTNIRDRGYTQIFLTIDELTIQFLLETESAHTREIINACQIIK